MRVVFTALLCLLCAPFLACDDGSVVSITMDQRSTQAIRGLGLGGAVSIHIGDIETARSPFRSNGFSIEELTVKTDDAVLAYEEDVRVLQIIEFEYEGAAYEIRIDGFEENLITDDEVHLVVYRQ